VGDRIVLRLPENPTTGFRWDSDFPSFLRLRRDTNEHGEAPGAGGFRILELSASAPGHEEISLSCKRPTDAASLPIDHFSLVLEVS
jgi:inhibitor of cysteine peptidase